MGSLGIVSNADLRHDLHWPKRPGEVVVVVAVEEKKTIPLPGGAELVKLAMSTNTGSVQPTGSATVLRLQ